MPLLLILNLAVQALLIVHVIKTGRNTLWIWAIALLPGAGWLAYAIAELLPSMIRSRAARRTGVGVQRMLDPNRNLRQAAAAVEVSGNADAYRRLAEELYRRGQYQEAIDAAQAGLKGIFTKDPTLLLGLAQAQFAIEDFPSAKTSLEDLVAHNPEFESAEARLLYARILDALGDPERAEREYALVALNYPGAEARVRYALFLKRHGKLDAARRVLKDLLDGAKLGPAHYRKAQSEWLTRARREL